MIYIDAHRSHERPLAARIRKKEAAPYPEEEMIYELIIWYYILFYSIIQYSIV